MSIVLVGLREMTAAMEELVARAEVAARVATSTGAHEVEREAKRQLGKTSHRAGTPTPAAPGQPPSLVSGTLRRSVQVEGPRPTGELGGWEAKIGPTVVYGRVQELGGMTGRGHAARLPARPFMRPALDVVMPRLGEIYRAAWGRAVH